jgi:hypothetical protein
MYDPLVPFLNTTYLFHAEIHGPVVKKRNRIHGNGISEVEEIYRRW